MDVEFWYFIIQLIVIFAVNSLFLAVNILFSITIAVILWYYQRKTQQVIKQAITDTQKMLKNPKTYKPLLKGVVSTFGGIISNIGQHGAEWIEQAGGDVEVASSFKKILTGFGDTVKKKRKLSTLGSILDEVKKTSKKKEPKEVNARPEVEVKLTKKQMELMEIAQREILTKEQQEILDGNKG